MLVAFAGCDGAGKTTQVERVRQWLERGGWQVSIVDRWDILDAEKFPECRFIRSSRRDLPLCISEMEGIARAMFLFWSVSLTLKTVDLLDSSRIYLLDGYWMKHGAAEIEYGCDPAWVEATVRCLPPVDMTLYLDITPEEALRRKPDLTPYECARNSDLSPEDFIRHQAKLRTRLLRWAHDFGWDVISSMQEPSLVTEQILSYLASRLQGPQDTTHGQNRLGLSAPRRAATRLLEAGVQVALFNRTHEKTQALRNARAADKESDPNLPSQEGAMHNVGSRIDQKK